MVAFEFNAVFFKQNYAYPEHYVDISKGLVKLSVPA